MRWHALLQWGMLLDRNYQESETGVGRRRRVYIRPLAWRRRYPCFACAYLCEHSITASTGSVGDSYDNALVENVNGSYKNELIHTRRWNDVVEVEIEFWEQHPLQAIIEIKASALEQNSGHFIMWCWWRIVITIGMVGCISLATI